MRVGYPQPMGGGYPHPANGEGTPIWLTGVLTGGLDGVPPHQDWMGVHPPIRRKSSRPSTFYVAGGVHLAFTQEDFLVQAYFHHQNKSGTGKFNRIIMGKP